MEKLAREQMDLLLSEVADGAEYQYIGEFCRGICNNAEYLETTLQEVGTLDKADELGLIYDLRHIQDVYGALESVNQEYEDRWI